MYKKISLLFILLNGLIGGLYASAATIYEIEPNDNIQGATSIQINDIINGEVDSRDVDFYSMNLSKPGNLSIKIANSTEARWSVYVYDSKGKELNYFVTNNNQFATEYQVDQIGLAEGTYYIKVSKYSGEYGKSEAYIFTTSFFESNFYEQEPNNDIKSATLLNVNNQYNGILHDTSDKDYYKFQLKKPGNLSISMPNIVDYSWRIELYDSAGKELSAFRTEYGSLATRASKDQIGLPAGTYYIKVENYSYYNNSSKVPYHFDISFDQSSFFELEPNASFQQATPIQFNYKYHGNLNSSNDKDYFSFTVEKVGTYTISMPLLSGSSWGVNIYDAKSNRLKWFRTSYDSLTIGTTSENIILSPGTYYIEISDWYNSDKKPYSFVMANRIFKDVSVDFWGYNEITYLYNKGIIKGYDGNTFKPNNNVSKAQAAVMIARALNLNMNNVSNPGYSDVPVNFHAYKEIAAVTQAGIFSKVSKFNPNSDLSRGEMALALVKAYKLTGSYTGKITDVKDSATLNAVNALAANNITNIYSDNTFKPKNSVNRAQFSAFFTRILNEEYRQ